MDSPSTLELIEDWYPNEELLLVEPTNEFLRFFLCEQSLGILNTHLLWKFRPQYSHFRP